MDISITLLVDSEIIPDHYPISSGEWFEDTVVQHSQDSLESEFFVESDIALSYFYKSFTNSGLWYQDSFETEFDEHNVISGDWYEDSYGLDVTLSNEFSNEFLLENNFELTVNDPLVFGTSSATVAGYTNNADGTRNDVQSQNSSLTIPDESESITFSEGGDDLEIKRPIFGDRTAHETYFEQKITPGGCVILTENSWPQSTILRFQFVKFSKDDYEAVETFVVDKLGLEVDLTFYNGKTYSGFFINPSLNLNVDGRECAYNFDLEFEICFE